MEASLLRRSPPHLRPRALVGLHLRLISQFETSSRRITPQALIQLKVMQVEPVM